MMVSTIYLEPDNQGKVNRLMTCSCGKTIQSQDTGGHDFVCRCGTLYNCFGQEISHPFGNGDEEYWAEEERW